MRKSAKLSLQLTCLAVLAACASGDPVAKPDEQSIAEMIGCTEDQIAVCVDVNCEPEDYVCSEREEMRNLFEPRITR